MDVNSQGRILDPVTGVELPQADIIAALEARLGPGGLATLNNPNRGWSVDPFYITHRIAENTTETTPEEVETVAEKSGEVTSIADTGNQLGCKKFFPAVGMTLSVPCE